MTHVTPGGPARRLRRQVAETLAAARAERSPQTQLDLLAKRPGESKKESARLRKMRKGAR